MKKRLIIITGLIVLTLCILGGLSYNFFYKSSLIENKTNDNNNQSLALYMCDEVAEDEIGDTISTCIPINSIPVGNYRIDPFKSYCENGEYSDYDKENGTIKYVVNGTGECSVYFRDYYLYDYIVENANRMNAKEPKDGASIVFQGKNPQNYVLIDGFLFRIAFMEVLGSERYSFEYRDISVESDGLYRRDGIGTVIDDNLTDVFFYLVPSWSSSPFVVQFYEIDYFFQTTFDPGLLEGDIFESFWNNDFCTFDNDNLNSYFEFVTSNLYLMELNPNLPIYDNDIIEIHGSGLGFFLIMTGSGVYRPMALRYFDMTSPYDYCHDETINEFISGPCLNENWMLNNFEQSHIVLSDIKNLDDEGYLNNYYLYNNGETWNLNAGDRNAYPNATIPLYSLHANYSFYVSGSGTIDDPIILDENILFNNI